MTPPIPHPTRPIVAPPSAFDELIAAMTTIRPESAHNGHVTETAMGFGRALIESWASVLDILHFYGERLRDESYLSEALETWSINQHAHLLGYQPAPGLSATAYLAFTLSTSAALPMPTIIPAGTVVRSAPLGTSQPQVFETSRALHAHATFNAMSIVRQPTEHKPTIHPTTTVVHLHGAPSLVPGDALRITSAGTDGSQEVDLRIVQHVGHEPGTSVSTVTIAPSSTAPRPVVAPQVTVYKALGGLFGHNAPLWEQASNTAQQTFGIPLAGAYFNQSPGATKWAPTPPLSSVPTCSLAVSGRWLVGTATHGVIARSFDGNTTPTPTTGSLPAKAIYALASDTTDATGNTVLAGGANGTVFRSIDGGRQWDRLGGRRSSSMTQGQQGAPTVRVTRDTLPPAAVRSLLVVPPPSKAPSPSSSLRAQLRTGLTRLTSGSAERSSNGEPSSGESGTSNGNPGVSNSNSEQSSPTAIYAGTDQGLYVANGLANGWEPVSLASSTSGSEPVVWALYVGPAASGSPSTHHSTVGNASNGNEGSTPTLIFAGTDTTILEVPTPAPGKQQGATSHAPACGRVYGFAAFGPKIYAATANGVYSYESGAWDVHPNWTTFDGGAATAIAATQTAVYAWSPDRGLAMTDKSGVWRAVPKSTEIAWPAHTGAGALASVIALATHGDAVLALSDAQGFANAGLSPAQWPDFVVGAGCRSAGHTATTACLDLAASASLAIGDVIALQNPVLNSLQPLNPGQETENTSRAAARPTPRSWPVEAISNVKRSDFGLTASVQRATIRINDGDQDALEGFDLRTVRAFKATDNTVELAGVPGRHGSKAPTPTPSHQKGSRSRTPIYGLAVDSQKPTRNPLEQDEQTELTEEVVKASELRVVTTELPEPGRLVAITGLPCRGRLATPGGVRMCDENRDWRWLDGFSISAMASDKEDVFAATVDGPIFRVDPRRDRVKDTGFAAAHSATVLAVGRTTLWAGTENGEVYAYTPGTKTWNEQCAVSSTVRALLEVREPDELLAGTDTGVFRIDLTASNGEQLDRPQRELPGQIRCLVQTGDLVLAGTADGVWKRGDTGWKRLGRAWERDGQSTSPPDVVAVVDWRNHIHAVTTDGELWKLDSTEVWSAQWVPWPCQETTNALVRRNGSLAVAALGALHELGAGEQYSSYDLGVSNAVRHLVEVADCDSDGDLAVGSEATVFGIDEYGARSSVSPPLVCRLDLTKLIPDTNESGDTAPLTDLDAIRKTSEQIARSLNDGIIPPELVSNCPPHTFPRQSNVHPAVSGFRWTVTHGSTVLYVTLAASQVRVTSSMQLLPILRWHEGDDGIEVQLDTTASGVLNFRLPNTDITIEAPAKHTTPTSEIRAVTSATTTTTHARIQLDRPLDRVYEAASTTVNANVIDATQGQTIRGQVVGSGDAAKSLQSFSLRPGDLSYVVGADGFAQPSVSVRVGDHSPVLTPTGPQGTLGSSAVSAPWTEVDSLLNATPGQHAFMVRQQRTFDGTATSDIVFGDGTNGARLPTGSGNVAATFRVGVGGASLPAGSVHVVGDLPSGVRSVANPTATEAGIAPADGDDLKASVPVWTHYTPRVVSLSDYEAFALQYPGIGKVEVAELFDGQRRAVHLSVTDVQGLAPSDSKLRDLHAALDAKRLGTMPLRIDACETQWFSLGIELTLDANDDINAIRNAVIDGLTTRFSSKAGIIAAPLQSAAIQLELKRLGVLAHSDIVEFVTHGCAPRAATVLEAQSAQYRASLGRILPASLLALAPATLQVTVKVAS